MNVLKSYRGWNQEQDIPSAPQPKTSVVPKGLFHKDSHRSAIPTPKSEHYEGDNIRIPKAAMNPQSADMQAFLKRHSFVEQIIGLIFADIYKEHANISDQKLLTVQFGNLIVENDPMGSFAYLNKYGHMSRNCSRAGICRMLYVHREFWLFGVDLSQSIGGSLTLKAMDE